MDKQWKTFHGYQVSNYGEVELRSGKITKGWDKNGYKGVTINNTKYYIHRIVAELFCEGWFDGAQVDHIDRDPSNNRADNLRWVNQSVNIKNQGERKKPSKVPDNVVLAMTILKNEYCLNNAEISRILGVDRRYVSRILLGYKRKDLTGL